MKYFIFVVLLAVFSFLNGKNINNIHLTGLKINKEFRKTHPGIISNSIKKISSNDLPKSWDWRNVNGVNYCSPIRAQSLPQPCGSCWAQATVASMNDRVNIVRSQIKKPMDQMSAYLSVQHLVACGNSGDCDGGEPWQALDYLYNHGIPDETCNNYKAVNQKCDAFAACGNCHSTCFTIPNYNVYKVSDYAKVQGINGIKNEIMQRGPIICAVAATEKFVLNYTLGTHNGIYSEYNPDWSELNHAINVIGWGYDESSQTEYWIGRNSWGRYWGDDGWFKIVMGKNEYNLGIETDCMYGVPIAYPEPVKKGKYLF